MKKLFVIAVTLLVGINTIAQEQQTYFLDTEQSVINWIGNYAFNFSEHTGTVQFSSGELTTVNGNITGGSFIIDMTTISNAEYLEGIGPVAHLRDTDFFNVLKYPQATLVINSVEFFPNENLHKILANLTIKGITKPIEFWATASEADLSLETQFKIDRTRWGITYNNKLKNHAIAEGVGFKVYLKFKAN